ncbi:MAG: SCO1664 family protein [Streptomyces sp.]|uniref:SCO1664 family protein n=1 Tax=Streptomyces sp. TaxID=1931 RepID=UPI003D6BC14D
MSEASGSGSPPRRGRLTASLADERTRTHLALGTLTVRGRIREASNAVLFGEVEHEGRGLPCVYKPVAGERPLWDFPDGTLAQREVAAYEVSRAGGWDLIPATVLRDGPYGEGMCQAWLGPLPGTDGTDDSDGTDAAEDPTEPGAEQLLGLVEGDEPGEGWKPVGFVDIGEGRTALLVHADDTRLRRLAVLDAVINNGDRKGGHLLPVPGGRLYAIDHGVTFHVDDKLRTLLWGWAGEELTAEAAAMLRGLSAALSEGAPLAVRLAGLVTAAELDAVRKRTDALCSSGRHPLPSGDWPAIPWPPV